MTNLPGGAQINTSTLPRLSSSRCLRDDASTKTQIRTFTQLDSAEL